MYATLDDLLDRVSAEAILGAVGDEPDDPEADPDDVRAPHVVRRVEQAILDASATVDAYVRRRMRVPLSPVPDVIRRITADLAIYNLFGRRGFNEDGPDKDVIRRRDAAIRFLEQVANGLVLIGPDEPPKGGRPKFDHAPRIFSRRKMKGY